MAKKAEFATRIGLIAATVGSAVGLGNVWRFPAETQENGGAAFLLLYVICVLALGVPVMLGEMVLGRGGRSDAIGVMKRLARGTPWWIVGAVAILASYLIAVFYMVVAGWTLEYLVCSFTGTLYGEGMPAPESMSLAAGAVRADAGWFGSRMAVLLQHWWPPLLATVAVILLNITILLRGVQKGIEKLSNLLMPLLFLILAALCVVAFTLPGASEGLRFFLSPDFSKIDAEVVINALGQTFFSLSLGMGILVTYSSYYPMDANLPRTSVTVALLSLLVAVMTGCVIFPAVTTFGLQHEGLEGTTLIFLTLPEVFARLPLAPLWSGLFFLLLFVAAITSTVSISEVSVAMLIDRFRMSRRRAVLTAMLPLLFLSGVCSMSVGPWKGFTLFGMSFFDFLDTFATNILLPLVGIGTCLFVGWFGPGRLLRRQLSAGSGLTGRGAALLTGIVGFILRWVAPVCILLIFLYRFF
ncbi:MAG: sodium-dependent transporter [Muribaculaceae bacterium]|nr:sodium-dependent transporter [Muribaculaceae bacterium]